MIANTIVHEIVVRHTSRPESKNFLRSEITEYRSQTEKMARNHAWNDEDKKIIMEKSTKRIKEKLDSKYPDVSFRADEAERLARAEIEELGL